MKNFFYLAFVLIAAQSCSVSQANLGAGPKNLIKNSEFAIVTPKHDTLFLCRDDETGRILAQLWKEGKFKEPGNQTEVVVLDCNKFEKLVQRVNTPTTLVSAESK